METGDWVQIGVGAASGVLSLIAIGVSLRGLNKSSDANKIASEANQSATQANKIASEANQIAKLSTWRALINELGGDEIDSVVKDKRLFHALCAPPPPGKHAENLTALRVLREESGLRLEKLSMFEVAGAKLAPARAAVDLVWDSALEDGKAMTDDRRKHVLKQYKEAVDAYVAELRELMQKI